MSWLPVTVRVCAGFLQHECVLALTQYVCVLVMIFRSTGMCFTILVVVSHSTYVCVLAVFTVCVCNGHGFSQQVCVLAAYHST